MIGNSVSAHCLHSHVSVVGGTHGHRFRSQLSVNVADSIRRIIYSKKNFKQYDSGSSSCS